MKTQIQSGVGCDCAILLFVFLNDFLIPHQWVASLHQQADREQWQGAIQEQVLLHVVLMVSVGLNYILQVALKLGAFQRVQCFALSLTFSAYTLECLTSTQDTESFVAAANLAEFVFNVVAVLAEQ